MRIVLAAFILGIMAMSSSSCGSKMIVHVPKDYQGNIIIFFNEDTERGRIETGDGNYNFYPPEDGILFTRKSSDDFPTRIEIKDDKGHVLEPLLILERKNKVLNDTTLYVGDARGAIDYSFTQVGTKSTLAKLKYLSAEDIGEMERLQKSGYYTYWLKEHK